MNTNLIHNLLNVALAALAASLIASGCSAAATGTFDCSASWVDPSYTKWAILAIGGGKIVLNIWRDGVSGLAKPQPPVVPKTAPGPSASKK